MENKKFYLSENTWLFLIPIFGYATAYSFQYGYLLIFGLTSEFIDIEINSIVIATFALALILTILLGLVNLSYPIRRFFDRKNVLHLFIALDILLVFLFVAIYLGSDTEPYSILPPLGLIFILELMSLGLIYWQNKNKNLPSAQVFQMPVSEKQYNDPLLDYVVANYFNFLVLIMLGFVCMFLALIMGGITAKSKSVYSIFRLEDKNYALIQNYEDTVLLIEYSDNELKNNFVIINKDRLNFSQKYHYKINRSEIKSLIPR